MTVPAGMTSGAAGGAGEAVLYRPFAATMVQVNPGALVMVMVSVNWPLPHEVSLFIHPHSFRVNVGACADAVIQFKHNK